MKSWRTVSTALRALRRNPMRASLTTLGILFGVAAVIAMMEIGSGTSAALQKSIASMGSNVLMIFPGSMFTGGVSSGQGSSNALTPDDCAAILRDCPAIRAAAPIVRSRTQIIAGGKNWQPASMVGTTPQFLDVRGWTIAEGEPFTDRDVLNSNKVCAIGQTIVKELFDGHAYAAVGKTLRVNNVPFIVTGVLNRKGSNMMGQDQDDILVAPWTTIKYRVSGSALGNVTQSSSSVSGGSNTLNNLYPSGGTSLYPARDSVQAQNNPMPVRFTRVDQIVAAANSTAEISLAVEQITELLTERHRSEDFMVGNMTEMVNTFSSTARMMTVLLLIVASISLLVGGVGISNIMLVSVTERTREIGLRMAVGAQGYQILSQFLVEAVVLCLLGGGLGIVLGHLVSVVVRYFTQWPIAVSPLAIGVSVAVSALIGIFFGFYPAWKASKLDPIEALRYE